MNTRKLFGLMVVLALIILAVASVTSAQGPTPRAPRDATGTGFTYQGQLKNGGAPVNGTCTLAFRLYDTESAGSQIGNAITQTSTITNGLFTTQLNTGNEFGANAFNGDARWLEIRVSNACPSTGSFTTLTPRQAVTPAPYALTAMKTAYKNVLVVAKSGGHYNTISAALASITDNSATNRYLIWVAPGTYTELVTMKEYVDIEGAGEIATKITYTGSVSLYTGTVVGANNAELRFLTVENTGGNTLAIAIYNGSASPRLTHLTATASGGTDSNYGVYNFSSSSPVMTNVIATGSGGTTNGGVYNSVSLPTMTNVTATGSGSGGSYNYGIVTDNSSLTMTNVTATAFGGADNRGVYNFHSSPTIQNSVISASGGTSNYGIYNTATGGTYIVTVNNSQITGSTNTIRNDTEFTVRVGASKLDGGAVTGGGTFACVFTYNANYTALNSTCQ